VGLSEQYMRRLEDGTLVDLPKVIPPTANPKEFRDNLMQTTYLPKSEVDKLIKAVTNYIEE
jgi:hypothetical protein